MVENNNSEGAMTMDTTTTAIDSDFSTAHDESGWWLVRSNDRVWVPGPNRWGPFTSQDDAICIYRRIMSAARRAVAERGHLAAEGVFCRVTDVY